MFLKQILMGTGLHKLFTFPEIEAGAVLEYRYEILSGRIVELRDWYFQDSIPVRLSELKVEIPSWFNYVYFFQGGGSIEQETADVNKNFDFHGNQVAKLKTNYYRMTNVPALKEEPFITTMDDYRSRLTFQLQEIHYPGGLSRTYMSDWNSLAKQLMADEEFGLQLTKKKNFKILAASKAKEIINSDQSSKEKAVQLHRFLNNRMTWNKAYSVFSSEKLDDVFARKSGSAGQGNLMLLALLKQADIEAWPLLVSTRSNGRMVQLYPVLDQFNHVMVYTELDGEPIIMDVGNRNRSINLPRVDALNETGWVVSEEDPRWIDIEPAVSREVVMADFKLDANGHLSGDFSNSYEGYSAVNKRSQIQGSDKNKALKNQWKITHPTIQIDSLSFAGLTDYDNAFELYTYCDIPGAARMEGNRLFFKPVLISGFDKNPLKKEKRTYPVNIPYPIKENYILNLAIPEGFVVEKLPDPIHLVLPNRGAQFHYLIKQKGQVIHLISKINIQQLQYPSNEYGAIKSLLDMIVEKQLEEIVFRKREG